MNTQERIEELNKQKANIEGTVGQITQQIQQLQQRLALQNRDYLIIQGKLEILNELKEEE